MPSHEGSIIRKSIALLLTVTSVSLSYILINPQQTTYHVTPPQSPFILSFNTTNNVTTKVITPLNAPHNDPSTPVQGAPLKWNLPPLFVVSIFIILTITLYLFSFPPRAQPSLHLPHPPHQAGKEEDDEEPPLPSPPQIPLRSKIQKLLLLTLLFPILTISFYTTLTYSNTAPPTPSIIYQNETIAVGEVVAVEISANLSSLLLADPEPPGLPSGDCKW